MFLTAGQLAERYQVSLSTIRRWWAAGKLPEPIRPGGSPRWATEHIEAWEARGCRSSAQQLDQLLPS